MPKKAKNNPKNKKRILQMYFLLPGKITYPNGEIKIIKNLRKFCRENNLYHGAMWRVSQGKRKVYKGFKCIKIQVGM
jgi:hypothetical protein